MQQPPAREAAGLHLGLPDNGNESCEESRGVNIGLIFSFACL